MSNIRKLETQKQELIRKVGRYMEGQDRLPPLAARIYATLLLSEEGVTFEQLVTELQASKSTVCTHLNSLQRSEMISFYTIPGDRKRYFIIAPNLLINLVDGMAKKWEEQKNIQEEIIAYKLSCNEIDSEKPLDLKFHMDYLSFIYEAEQTVGKLKKNIQAKERQND